MADWIFFITYAVMLGSGVTALIKYVLRDNEIHRVNAVLIDTWEYDGFTPGTITLLGRNTTTSQKYYAGVFVIDHEEKQLINSYPLYDYLNEEVVVEYKGKIIIRLISGPVSINSE